jgi:ssDNA-binding Zn-finger/Zn-ribbon topoisomerase 1
MVIRLRFIGCDNNPKSKHINVCEEHFPKLTEEVYVKASSVFLRAHGLGCASGPGGNRHD